MLCKLQYSCPAIKSDKTFSKDFYKFLKACLTNDPAQRPSINELLEFQFFKQAKNSSYLESQLMLDEIQELPYQQKNTVERTVNFEWDFQ